MTRSMSVAVAGILGLAACTVGENSKSDASEFRAASNSGNTYHLLRLRNTTAWAVEYCLSDGPVNTGTTWVGIQPGQTRAFWPREGQYLYVRWGGTNGNGGQGLRCPAHPHRQWWWKVTGNLGIVGDPERVPPGYNGN